MHKINYKYLFQQLVAVFKLTQEDSFQLIKESGHMITSLQINSILVSDTHKKAVIDERLSSLASERLVDGLLNLPQFSDLDNQTWNEFDFFNKIYTLLGIDEEKYLKLTKSKKDLEMNAIHYILDLFK
jgi:hypothetical protein